MAKPGYKFQVSKTYPNNMMLNVRADTQDEFETNIEAAKNVLRQTGMLKKDDAPSPAVQQQDSEYSQDPEDFDPSYCYIHRVPMKEYTKEQTRKDGTQYTSRWYSHQHEDGWCKGTV